LAELNRYLRMMVYLPGSRGLLMLVISSGLIGLWNQSCLLLYLPLEMVRNENALIISCRELISSIVNIIIIIFVFLSGLEQ